MQFLGPAIIIIVLIVFFTMVPIGLWITARFSGVNISMASLVAMRFRRLNPNVIVNALIKSHQAGIPIRTEDLESHYLAGGNINQVVDALIAAERANIELPFEQAAAIDLAGRNVFEAVQVSVTPKVINTPVIAAVAKNGIEVKVIAKVTVRANIDRLVGGAGEETIIARVGEGIVTTVGSAGSHAQVLENPDNISQTVLLKGLDSGTAYEILSIDIADVDVGRNVGAELQRDQAEADKNIAQAKAEERRAQAIALEQENKAKVVEAEARIPKAIADAFESGNLGIMDYYNMKNINADTKMRESLSDVDSGDYDV
ncbi:flotillin-like protein FloA [Anaerococcus cruorum]|uniref:Flotillin-like protein FloA n=1 Tax=Anaerococcus cruorum TaxID=3115617 RepID=A0ABW9MU57_9FIRM